MNDVTLLDLAKICDLSNHSGYYATYLKSRDPGLVTLDIEIMWQMQELAERIYSQSSIFGVMFIILSRNCAC